MKKIKEFYKKHEREIKSVGLGVGLATAGIIGYNGGKRIAETFINRNKTFVDMTSRNFVSWELALQKSVEYMDLEGAKKILDLKTDNESAFVMFKNGTDYICVDLADGMFKRV